MDSDGGVYQDTVKDHVGVVCTLLSLSRQESSPRRQIPMNRCRTTLTNQIVIINGVQATSFNTRHLFRQYTLFLHSPGWGPSREALAPALYSGVGNHPDVPQLLDECLSNSSRAAYSYHVYTWPLHLHGGVPSVGWPWTLSGSSGCPEFLSSQRLSRTTSVQFVHTLLSPHFFSPRPAVFWWLFPHAHPQVSTGFPHTSSHRRGV